jgi:RNA polymerase sigma-70 factor (ECF subfamily)
MTALSSSTQSAALFDPARLPDHIHALYSAACALGGSRTNAEYPVRDTFAKVLNRARFSPHDRELEHLLQAVRNTYSSRYRATARHPTTIPLLDVRASRTAQPRFAAGEILPATASAPPRYRDAVIAVNVGGISPKEAARSFRVRAATITTRHHRGRQHVARVLATNE